MAHGKPGTHRKCLIDGHCHLPATSILTLHPGDGAPVCLPPQGEERVLAGSPTSALSKKSAVIIFL